MRVLAIREPWASLIMSGDKKLEIRSRNTNIRERIAIYASLTKMKQRDLDWLTNIIEIPDTHPGHILGTVDLVNCTKVDWNKEHLDMHWVNPAWYEKEMYAWYMDEPTKWDPFEWKMPPGAVVWAKYEGSR